MRDLIAIIQVAKKETIHKFGNDKCKAYPGDILEVIATTTFEGIKGKAWVVYNEMTDIYGYIGKTKAEKIHNVYKRKQK